MEENFIIGITGGSGSGKTTIIKEIKGSFDKQDLCIISLDDYYKLREEQKVDDEGVKNFDLPESIELAELHEDVQELLKGNPVNRKEYTFNNEKKRPRRKTFLPAPIIIVEGLFVFTYKPLREMFNLKVFIEAKDHLKVIRRINRDRIERNYPLDDVLYRYEHHVQPAYEKYVLPYKEEADIVINNNKDYRKGLNVLTGFLHHRITRHKESVS